MTDKTQSRKWLLTINNPEKHGCTHETIKVALSTIKDITYWCMCDETGKGDTYHTHLFIYRKNTMRFSMIKNKFPVAHIDYCRGTAQENRDYIRKEGKYGETEKAETNHIETFEEFGECPVERQGARNDLTDLYDMIKEGCSDYEILAMNPSYMMQLDKIERCRQIVNEEKYKHEFRQMQVEYWYGKSGAGKTRTVMEKYNYEAYRVTDQKHPFDGYAGQDVIIFEEFRSTYRIQDMLNYLDGYPLRLPCRYNNKMACYTKVYLLSNVDLKEQYRETQREYEETWNAFLRRIHKVKVFTDKGIVDYENVNDYLHGFRPVIDEKELPFD